MKILITGKNGYISNALCRALSEEHDCSQISVREGAPSLSADVVIHAAGIAHKRASFSEYMRVNVALSLDIINKARLGGVRRFVFISTIALFNSGKISKDTPINIKKLSNYARSKFLVENALKAVASEDFSVSVLRLPMVYGQGCPGNFPKLVSFIKRFPAFLVYENKRSQLYIENLCAYVKSMIKQKTPFCVKHLADPYPASTTEVAREIARALEKKRILIKTGRLFDLIIRASPPSFILSKLFGDLYFEPIDNINENIIGFPESVRRSVM